MSEPQARPADEQPAPEPERARRVERERPGRSRTGAVWAGLWGGAAALVVVLVFIFQNLQKVKVSFFAASGRVPLAVALLGAAVLGALVVLVPGSVRILQLRREARRARTTRRS